ncbi:MAG: hypothetical protein DI527_07560 [Chelatococcus sp.]|nr:MAG: hypothetical protein DI527_07560 [Chelatococcus sp.]
MSTLRPVEALTMPEGWTPAELETFQPRFEWVAPSSLLIDSKYQRNLTEASVRLIHRIAAGWSWRRFKPPICAETDAGLHILDGQHTAIGAATHGGIQTIPVMIVEGADQLERARAFLGHNRDRVGLTALSLFHAAVAAGDESAETVMQVCGRAGVKVLRTVRPQGVFEIAETVAVAALAALCRRRTAMQARVVLELLAQARLAPITSDAIKAAEELLHGSNYAGEISADDLKATLIGRWPDMQRKAADLALAKSLPKWRALAITLYQNTRKRRAA